MTELAVGEALVSMLDENGVPTAVERARIRPPASRLGPPRHRRSHRRSRRDRWPANTRRPSTANRLRTSETPRRSRATLRDSARKGPTGRRPAQGRETPIEALAKGAARSIGSTLGRQIVRGVLGAILRGR
ncbi:MAG: helicase HerA-like domain-containing protein [Gammaproteobacteria bacterium]